MRAAAGLRRAAATFGLALASLGVALLAAELTLRAAAWLGGPAAPPPADPELAALPELRNLLELAQPNARGRYSGTLWRTNSGGFRGPEVPRRPPPGAFRIAVIGDSFVAGTGVAEQDTYAAQLERLLRESGSARFEVLNFGIPGLDIEQALGRGSALGERYRPHLFVYGMTLNDIDRGSDPDLRFDAALNRRIGMQALRFAGSPSYLLRALWPRFVSLRLLFFPRPDEDYGGALARAYRDPEAFARIERGLDGFEQLAERGGVCVHLLIHTELAHLRFAHPFREAYAQVERAARERGLSVTQSFPAYRWRDSANLRLSVLDGHPNAEGHRILAEALYAGLRELPPHCRVPALPAR